MAICSQCGHRCRSVFVERLDWLAKNPRFTQRFPLHVSTLCRERTNTAVAQAERLHDSTVKDLDRIYLQQQLARAGLSAPRAIGVDEIAIRKGHDYRIVVSDLERRLPIWVGGEGRPEADIDRFFANLGQKRRRTSSSPDGHVEARFASSPATHHEPALSSTSSTSCATSAMRSTPSAAASPAASPARTALYQGQRYSLSHRYTSSWTAAAPSTNCSRPTSGSTPPTCSKSPLGRSGATRPRRGAAPSSALEQSLKWHRLTPYANLPR